VTYLVAKLTFSDVFLGTIVGNVTGLVALETELLMTVERIVRVFAAQYAA